MQSRIHSFLRAMVASALLAVAAQAHAVTEIQWWHAMTGANNDRVNALAKKFNESQSDYKVTAVYKGSYPEAMAAAIAAYRAGNAPTLLQVFEVGHRNDDGVQGRDQAGVRSDGRGGREVRPEGLRSRGVGYYTNYKGQMLSLPFNSSTTVFWYNKDAFEKAGLDPNQPPATWPEVGRRDGEAQGLRPRLPVHDRLAGVDAARELLGVAQRSLS